MGVRMYTLGMISAAHHSPAGASDITVAYPGGDAGVSVQGSEQDIVAWVNSRPAAGPMHFYFSASARTNLRLQRTLMSMGCIVTRRFHITH